MMASLCGRESWDKRPDVGTEGAAVSLSEKVVAMVVTSERLDAGRRGRFLLLV